MVNLRLVHYIEKELDKNFQRDRIKNILVKYGYKELEVDGAFKYLDEKKEGKHIEQTSSADIIAKAEPQKERHFGLILLAILLLIIGSFVIVKLSTNDEPIGPLIVFNETEPPINIDYSEFNVGSTHDALALECMKEYYNEEQYDHACYAIASQDEDECKKDNECEEFYYTVTAVQNNQKTTCQKIKDSASRQFCHQLLDRDDSKCGFLETKEEQDQCSALVNSNEDLCHDEDCRDLVIYNDALRQKDKSLCRLMNSVRMKNRCLATFTKETNDCANKENCLDDAWFNTALLTRDPTHCQNIIDEQYKVSCTNMVTKGDY